MSVTVAVEQGKAAKMVYFTVGSWTFEQYEQACNEEKFYDSVKENLRCPGFQQVDDKKELLLCKYDFAGGCARWMFEFNYDEWTADFEKHLNDVNDYEHLFNEGSGDETHVAVNHLRGATVLTVNGIQKKKYFFISKHAARELGKKCSDKRKFLIASYKKAAETKNPAFGGWIFEFDVDYQLQDACDRNEDFKVHVRSPQDEKDGAEGGEERRPVSRYVEFAAVSDLVAPIQQLAAGQVLWAKPALWCQKAYDFLCFWKESNLLYMLAANASHAKKHSVLLNVVNQLGTFLGAQGCAVEAIRFDFLVPTGAEFRVGAVEGRLSEWNNLAGVKWPNAANTDAYLAGNFIVVADVAPTAV